MKVEIDPKKPVKGNLKGTLAGAAATVVSGYALKTGLITTIANFFCEGTATCADIETSLFILLVSVVGGGVNYAVTHSAQVKKLSDLYDKIPTTYAEYPKGRK